MLLKLVDQLLKLVNKNPQTTGNDHEYVIYSKLD